MFELPSIKLEVLQTAFPNNDELFIVQQVFKIEKNGNCILKAVKPRVPTSASEAKVPLVRKAMYVWQAVTLASNSNLNKRLMDCAEYDLPRHPLVLRKGWLGINADEHDEVRAWEKAQVARCQELADRLIHVLGVR